MFELGPHHKDAFAKEARRLLIDEQAARLREKGFQAAFDEKGGGLTVSDGSGPAATLLFDESLRLTGYRQPSGRVTRMEYPSANSVRTTSPEGTVTETETSSDGTRLELRQPGVATYRIENDPLGRPGTIHYPDGTKYSVEWGADNLPSQLVDRLGSAWHWDRSDDSGLVSAMRDPLGRVVRFEADADGLPARIVDAAGQETRFQFQDTKLTVTGPADRVTTFELTAENTVDARWSTAEGIRYRQDEDGNLLRAEQLGSKEFVEFGRDESGEIVSESTPQGTIELVHDEQGRLVTVKGAHEASIGYEHDADGRVVAVTAWDGYRIDLSWDGDDRLSGLRYPGGVTEKRTHRGGGRTASIEITDPRGNVVVRQAYGYDALERIVDLEESAPTPRTRRFAYDAESHLLGESDARSGKPIHQWQYDAKGNLVSENGARNEIGADDRFLSVAGKPILWDSQGCASQVPAMGGAPALELTFSESQLLRSVVTQGTAPTKFDYDPVGRRTAKSQGTIHTRFRWCRHQMLREVTLDARGEPVVREWLYLPQSYTPLAMRETRTGVTTHYSIHEDARGAVVAMLDGAGKLVWHGQYDAFGACKATVDLIAQPWRLQGQYFDAETGLHYNQARYYSPALKSYLSRDPRWLEWEATTYSYGRNDPWNRADPSGGLAFLLPMAIGAVVGGVIGGISAAASGGNVLAGIAGGAVGGAVSAIPGAGLLLGALSGALGSAITDFTTALLDGKAVCIPCLLKSMASGALGGLLGGAAGKLFAKLGKVATPLVGKVKGALRRSGAKVSPKASASTKMVAGKEKKLYSKCVKCPGTGKPVSLATGEKFLVHEDFSLPGRIPIDWTRYYLSSDARDGWFGQGWTCQFAVELSVDDEMAHFFDIDGRDLPLPHVQPGEAWMDPLERVQIERDATGRYAVVRKEDGLRYVFDARNANEKRWHRLARIEDRNGNAIQLVYQRQDDPQRKTPIHRPISVRDTTDWTWHFDWDDRGHLVEVGVTLPENPGTRVTVARYEYDTDGDLRGAATFDVRAYRYEWDRHMLVGYTMPDGAIFRQEWEALAPSAKCIRSYSVDGTVDDRLSFSADGKETVHSDVLGRVTRYFFDEHHIHLGTIDAAGHETSTQPDPNGNPLVTLDALGRETQTIYDTRGNLVYLKDAAGAETRVEYGGFDLPVKITDPLGQVWTRAYDGRGNLVSAVDPLGQETRYDYDARGQVIRVIDAKGGVSRLAWDTHGELVSYTDCSGKTTRFEHDAWGRYVGAIDALGQPTRLELDALGRVVAQQDAVGALHRFEWDPLDRLKVYVDPLGARTAYEYDGGGRPTSRRNPLGHVLRYEYDRAGRLARLINEKGEPYRFAYDVLDQVIEEVGFDGRLQRYAYNAGGELTHVIEPGGTEAGPGLVARFDRDGAGRMVTRTSGDGASATYAYDPLGRVTEAVNDSASVDYDYDPLGNVLKEVQGVRLPGQSPRSLEFAHAYDPLGNRTQTRYPSGRVIDFQLYGSGHLHGVLLDGNELTSIDRDDLHREISRTQGALQTDYRYDPQGRLTQARTLAGGGRSQVALIDRRYRYDIAGRLESRVDMLRKTAESAVSQREYAYRHDAAGQLVASRLSGAVSLNELFAFDPAGNLLPGDANTAGQSAGLVKQNRLLVYQDMRFDYDMYGNVAEKRKGTNQIWRFAYDSDQRMTQATVSRNGTQQTNRYFYDAFGRRVAKADEFGATVFGWDGDRVSHEARGSKVQEYLYQPDSFVPVVRWDGGTSPGSDVAKSLNRPEVLHFHVDQIGTPCELTRQDGAVVWRATARAWGNVLVEEVQECEQALRFQGQYFDVETGLHYNRFRYFDPAVGRYASADPIGLRGGRNQYTYADGSPVGWVDPMGLVAGDCVNKNAARNVDKGLAGRGFVPPDGTRRIPEGIPDSWRVRPTKGEGGVWYYDPSNKGNAVRVMPGDPKSPFKNSQTPYVRWQKNGIPLDAKGNPLPTKFSPDAHIPLGDFRFDPKLFP